MVGVMVCVTAFEVVMKIVDLNLMLEVADVKCFYIAVEALLEEVSI